MLPNYWNLLSVTFKMIKKDVRRNFSKLISFLLFQPPRHAYRSGKKLRWQRHNLKLINCNFSKLLFCKHSHSKFILRLKRNLWCIFWKLFSITQLFPPSTCWRKNWRSACADQGFSFKNGAPPSSRHILSLGFNGTKHQKLKCWFS